jgi:large-conductance mechanosensitive channel
MTLRDALCTLIFTAAMIIWFELFIVSYLIAWPQFFKWELFIAAILLFLCIIGLLISIGYVINKMRQEKDRVEQKIEKITKRREEIKEYLDEITSPSPQMTKECSYCGTSNEISAKTCRGCNISLDID